MTISQASQNLKSKPRRSLRSGLKQMTAGAAATLAIALHLTALPTQADPFRAQNPKPIGPRTEAAFEALFKQGNYVRANELLRTAETNEPLAYALKASLAYLNSDLQRMQTNAAETLRVAQQLKQTDPLRGNLYTAAGRFLEGAYTFSTAENRVAAAPQVLGKLQEVFAALNAAESINPNDPELNLLKGYMDLMLAVNLPFTDPNAAIERLNRAAPGYLAYRGMAVGYRDLRQTDKALEAVNKAIAEASSNPELYYLKAQILVRQGNNTEAKNNFRRALERRSQLPNPVVRTLIHEQCRNEERIARVNNPQDNMTYNSCLQQLQTP